MHKEVAPTLASELASADSDTPESAAENDDLHWPRRDVVMTVSEGGNRWMQWSSGAQALMCSA